MTIETALTLLTFLTLLLLCLLIIQLVQLQVEYEKALILMQRTLYAANKILDDRNESST